MIALLKSFSSTQLARWFRVICILFVLNVEVFAENAAELFNNANKLYEQQKFSAAAAEYEKLIAAEEH